MKRTFKVLGIIAIVAVIGFSFVACGGDDDSGGGSGGGSGGSGGISGGTVTYPDGIEDADKPIDFSYSLVHDGAPLSQGLNGTSSVTISNGRLNIILGEPKDASLDEPWNLYVEKSRDEFDGVTVTPSDAKLLELRGFSTVDQKYVLICGKTGGEARLTYANKDVTIRGTVNYRDPYNINISLKKGWNYVVKDRAQGIQADINIASTKQPNGYNWIVFRYN